MMQVTKVWWDGEKLMAEPIDPAAVYKEAAQPAVPDEITAAIENPEYRDGWNDCRSLMLKGMKP
jgi:hypothetical protein